MADPARLDELRRRFQENPRRFFAPLASALRRAGDPQAAATLAQAQLAVYPEHLTGHVILGQALLDVGDARGARVAFDRAAALDGGNVVALQNLLTLARQAGDRAEERRWAAQLAEADPELAAEIAPATAAFEPLDLDDFDFGGQASALDPRYEVGAPAAGRGAADADRPHEVHSVLEPAAAPVAEPALTDEREPVLDFVSDATPVAQPGSVQEAVSGDARFDDDWGEAPLAPPADGPPTDGPAADGPPANEPFADDAPGGEPLAAAPLADLAPADADAHTAPGAHGAHDLTPIAGAAEAAELADVAGPARGAGGDAWDDLFAPLDPVVGLDEPPADPVPPPMREALPDLPPAGVAETYGGDAAPPPDAPPPPAAPFVTETMAGLLLAQGHSAQALAVYEQLLAQRPHDAALQARLAALRGGAEAEAVAPHGGVAELVEAAPAAAPDVGPAEAPPADDGAAHPEVAGERPTPVSARRYFASLARAAAEVEGRREPEPEPAEPVAAVMPAAEPAVADGPDAGTVATGGIASNTAAGAVAEPGAVEGPSADDARAAGMWRAAFAPLAAAAPSIVAPEVMASTEAPLDDLSFDRFFSEPEASADPAAPFGDFERWAAEADAGAAGAPAAADPAAGAPARPEGDARLSWTAPAPLPASPGPPPASPPAPSMAAPSSPAAPADDADEDLAQFNAWLRGLAG